MKRVRPCARRWARALGLFAVVAVAGCGSDELVFPGIVPTETAIPVETPTCGASGEVCMFSTDCCSGNCMTTDGVDFFCQ